MLNVKCKIWIENTHGQAFLGDGRADLLQAVEETGSLSAAAKRMGMSYRKAWYHLNAMEKAFGARLVDRSIGGRGGGGCKLTETGRATLSGFFKFRRETEQTTEKLFQKYFEQPR